MQMATVMMSTTINPVFLMEEIAVDLMSMPVIAQNVYVLKEEEGAVEELQLVEAAKRFGLVIGIVMKSTTIQAAPTMEEIAVDLSCIMDNAMSLKIVNAVS